MTRRCDLCVARSRDGFLIRVLGSGTAPHSFALAQFVRGCLREDPAALVTIDLLGCEYLDSTFLGCLLKLQQRAADDRYSVVADQATSDRLLRTTGLDRCLRIIGEAPMTSGQFVRIESEQGVSASLGRHMMETHAALGEIPSDDAESFRRIASQLEQELEAADDSAPSLFDTVVVPPKRPQ